MNILTQREIKQSYLEEKYKEFKSMFNTLNAGDIVSFMTPNGIINYLVVHKEKVRHLMKLNDHKVNRGNIDNPEYFKSAFRNRIMSGNIITMNIYKSGSFDVVLK